MASQNHFVLTHQQNRLFCGNNSTHLNPTFQLPQFPINMQNFPFRLSFASLNEPLSYNPAFTRMPISGLNQQVRPPIFSSFQSNVRPTSNFTPRFPNCGVIERNFLPCNPRNPMCADKFSLNLNSTSVDRNTFRNNTISKANRMGNKKFKGNHKLKRKFKIKPFYCDCCDRAFDTENELSEHLALHVKCDIGNCKFEAHFKVLQIHKKMQHETGYADRILKLESDEEIKRWIDERKKRFPTTENIMKLKAEEAEKEARGEIIQSKEFGKFKKQKFRNNAIKAENIQSISKRSSAFTKKRNRYYKKKKLKKNEINNTLSLAPNHYRTTSFEMDSDSDNDSHIKLKKFLGIVLLTNLFQHSSKPSQKDDKIDPAINEQINLISSRFHDSDASKKELDYEEINILNNTQLNSNLNANFITNQNSSLDNLIVKKNSANGLIYSINSVTNYDSHDDDDSPPSIMPILKSSLNNHALPPGLSKEGLKELKLKNNDNISINRIKGKVESKENCFKKSQLPNWRHSNPFPVVQKSTLLEKLLADNIRHERNVILQCIKHIVKNNFFGISS